MDAFWDNALLLLAMLPLVGVSAFFSASEAALFSLSWSDRRAMAEGTRTQRIAEHLLHDPDRLLSAVLFCNLSANMLYFTLGSVVGLRLSHDPSVSSGTVALFATGSLLVLIFFGELMPKTIGVVRRQWSASLVAIPMRAALAVVDPLLPWLRAVNSVSRRVVYPNPAPETTLDLADLERAIQVSTEDAELVAQEQTVLRNIVNLSDLRVAEWMRPRNRYRQFRPPISQSDLASHSLPSGYVLVTDATGEEVVASLPVRDLAALPSNRLERYASPTSIVPWCTSVAAAMQQMQQEEAEAATVVNELGETIGIITLPDILDAILLTSPERGERLLNREPMREVAEGRWQVDGLTNLRRLARQFGVELPATHRTTLGGVVEETLGRLPTVGDQCDWGPFTIVAVPAEEEETTFELSLRSEEESAP